jgi:signal transduction histidine kinase
MKIFFGTFFLFLCLASAAGNPEPDSLKRILNSGTLSADERFDALIGLARLNFRVSLDSALVYGLDALDFAKSIENSYSVAEASKLVGSVYYVQNNYVEALDYFQQALRINRELNNTVALPACYNNLGLVYNNLGYYNEALKNHLNQLSYNEELDNQRGVAISNRHIGNVYNNMGENRKALEYYENARTISEQLGDTNAIGTSLINLGVANMSLKNYKSALDNFSQALAIKQKVDDKKDIAKIYSNLGVIYRDEEKFEMAIDYFYLGLKLQESMNDRRGITVSLLNLGAVYLDIKEYEKSFDYLEQALMLATEIDMKKSVMMANKTLSKWYESQADFKLALKHIKLQTALSDSLFNIEKSRQIRDLQIVYEVEKKDKEILEQSISIREYQSRQLYYLLAFMLILGLAFIFYYRYRLKKRVNRELEVKIAEALKKQKEQQQIIVHQASLTSLGELAAGIAHEIKQPLQNISLSNESLDMENKEDDPDRKFISKTVKDIYEDIKRMKFIINEISNFSRGQQEELCEPFSVNTRIQNAFSLARTRFSNRRIDVKFNLNKNIPDIEGNPYKFEQVVVNFFNNAKDAIEEKAEKSQKEFKKWMSVKSFVDGEMVVVEVSDNGIGVPEEIKTNIFLPFFTTKDLGKGTGLGLSISLGIIKEMKGFIELESDSMKGTTMRVKIPVSGK